MKVLALAGIATLGLSAPALAEVTGGNADFRMTLSSSASKEAIYRLWADPTSWPKWDPQILSVRMNGPIKVGATGKLKGAGGPENTIEITAMEPGVRFAYVVKAPLARVRFERRFEPGDTTRFTHAVTFEGAGGGALSGILGKRFREGLPPAMENLKAAAEAKS
jgi:uncharacterized protein YndB with AHSA1/START domain